MKRNKFGLSHYKLLSCKAGQLVPVMCMDVLPGDTFRLSSSSLVRVAPLVHPVMHPTHISYRWFYVPKRITQTNFADKFITGGTDGEGNGSTWSYVTIPGGGYAVGSLADHLGVPTGQGATIKIDAGKFRAYQMIRNEYFRDKQLQTEAVVSKADGNDTTTSLTLQSVNWEKDYLTSARLDAQLGPDVTIDIGGTAPVVGNGTAFTLSQGGTGRKNFNFRGQAATVGPADFANYNYGGTGTSIATNAADSMFRFASNDTTGLVADLSAVTGISINQIREAFAQQSFQEHRSRFGDTYVEYLRYLGLHCSDARLQLPEYLGGYSSTIQFSEVLSNNGATGGNLGALGGHGIAAGRSNTIQRYFEEHGYLICVAYVRPKTVYMNSLHRSWSREFKEDYWQKEYEHTGQQEVKNKEVYLGRTTPEGTFGYQDVYDEYRHMESYVSGEFRSTLKDWNLARIIDSDGEATLDSAFVTADPRTDIYAAPSADNLYMMCSHRVKARRLLSKTGWSSNLGG